MSTSTRDCTVAEFFAKAPEILGLEDIADNRRATDQLHVFWFHGDKEGDIAWVDGGKRIHFEAWLEALVVSGACAEFISTYEAYYGMDNNHRQAQAIKKRNLLLARDLINQMLIRENFGQETF